MIQTVNINVAALPALRGPGSFMVLSQNENGRQLRFRILGSDLPTGCTATFNGTKPDGNVYSTTGTVSGNFVIVQEDIQMTAVAGIWDAKLEIAKGTENIVTSIIRVTVVRDPVAGDAIPSDSQLDGIVTEVKYYAEHARSEAYGSPLTASTKSAMTDKTRVYVYTGSEPNMVAGNWYHWNGTAWISGGVYNSVAVQSDSELNDLSTNPVQNKVIKAALDQIEGAIPEIDATLSTAGKAADAKKTGDEIASLKEDLNEIWSEQIVGMIPTERQKESVNLFKYAELVGEGKIIYSISNGKVVLTDSTTGYNTYLIPVDGESTYTFTNCRSAVLVSDRDYTAIGQMQTYTTSVDSTGGKYIIFSFNPTAYPVNTYSVTKPVSEYIIPNNWNLGDFEVETQQINGMLPTGKTIESSNLFSKASLVASGKYVDHITNGKAVLADSANLDTYIIPVDGESVYTFTNCRTAVVVSDLEYTAVGNLLTYATEINSTGGTYILFSFNRTTYPPTSYKVTKPVAEYIIPNNWNLDKGTKTGYQRKTGSIASGGSLALTGKTAIKYGYQIIFKAFISAFNEIKLAFYNYNNSAILNAINITATDLVIYAGSTAVETLPHGLTIANDISLVLDYRVDGIKITLYSNGESFTTTTTFVRLTSGVVSPSIISAGTVCTSATLEMTVPRGKNPIWYFGDSYISFTNAARWTYYLVHDDFDGNTLLNGYAGGTSATTVLALTALLQYGTPEYAVFATGMNDGSDSDSAPSTSWVNARDNFISLCESNGIEMIFATVPTVPSVNNEQKNAWVKSSGYRYIDFAKAVGADGTGAWYTGMLSSDNVHPTEKGAKALYTQVLIDLPEIMIDA